MAAEIHNGQSTLSIYVTGGESDDPKPAEYAAHRQDGTRAAYARMAEVAERWLRQRVPVGQDRFIEVDALAARPDVQVAFLNLPEDNNPSPAGGKHALARVWQDSRESLAVRPLVPVSGIVRDSYTYRRADILAVLEALFETFRPTVIRTQDPQPDARYQPQWAGFHDHPDHVVTARFAWEATQRYLARPGRDALVVNYRDYNVADLPINLSVQDQQTKRDYFATYVCYDAGANLAGSYQDWTIRSYYRWSRGSKWAGGTSHGHMHAFAVYGTRLVHWWRDDHWRWYAPSVSPPPGPLRPALTVLPDHTGQLVLLVQTWDGAQVQVSRQGPSPGAWQAGWTNLGNPGQQGADPTQFGTPTAVTDQQGRLVVVMRNAAGSLSNSDNGVSMRRVSPDDGDWIDLGGQVEDQPAAVVEPDGSITLLVTGIDGTLPVSHELPGTAGPAFREWQPALPWDAHEIRQTLVNGFIPFRPRLLLISTFCSPDSCVVLPRAENCVPSHSFRRGKWGMMPATTSSVGNRCEHPALAVRRRFTVEGKRAVIRPRTYRPCWSTSQAAPVRSEHRAIEPTPYRSASERAMIVWTRGRSFGRAATLRPRSRAHAVPRDNY